MVQALLNLDGNTNRILNLVKAKYDFKDKSEAVSFVVDYFIEMQEDPELRPEFMSKLKKLEKKGKFTDYKSLSKLRDELENA
jgi:hypothetical protein